MRFRTLAGIFAIWGLWTASTGASAATLPPAATNGVSWLQSQLQADGSLTGENQSIATPLQARSEAAHALSAAATVPASLASLVAVDTGTDTESLSRHLQALVESDADAAAATQALLANQNSDGGFGDYAGYPSTGLDTAFALQALIQANQTDSNAAHQAALYLQAKQSTDGSWSDWPGRDNAYTTALVLQALAPYRLQVASIGLVIRNGNTYLTSRRQSGTDWSEPFIDAEVILAFSVGNGDPALVALAAADLMQAQGSDGSWAEDPYVTALAVRALAAAAADAPPTQASGAAQGYVVEAATGRPIAGATVFLASNPEVTTTTNSSGYFDFTSLPLGQATLVAQAPGYSTASIVVSVASGPTTHSNQLVLGQSAGTGMVFGVVTSQQAGTPVAGAAVQLSGGSSYTATTAADGSFSLPTVTPGIYALQIGAGGYAGVSSVVTVAAGGELEVDQSLLLTGTYQNSSPITVTASIVDGKTGAPIAGASLSLSSSFAATADSSGNLSLGNVPLGSYQATVSAAGYNTAVYEVTFVPGSNGALGSLSIYATTGTVAANSLAILASVVDGLSNKPIVGATITDTDTGAVLTTDANGNATIGGLTTLTADLQVSASGYDTQAFSVTASGFGQVAQTLVLPASGGSSTATTVNLSGLVTDAVSGSPIDNAAVSLTYPGGEATTNTPSSGQYQLPSVGVLNFTLQVAATGYVTQTIPVSLQQFGNYNLPVQLVSARPASTLQVLSVDAQSSQIAGTATAAFTATVGNTGTADTQALIFAEVTDSNSDVIADLPGTVPGSQNAPASFDVPASGQVQVEFDWSPKQLPAAGYTVTVYVTIPGTATRPNPHGDVLAQGSTSITVTPTAAITGQLSVNPPLSQAGTQVPVSISALVINGGNQPLGSVPLQLTITDPASGNVLYSAASQIGTLPINNNVTLSFGVWVPTTTGNLKIHIAATDGTTGGTIDGTLYVGNKATGSLTVDRTILPPGNNTVHARVAIQGVDIAQAVSVDPLYFAAQRATTNAGTYVAANSQHWVNGEHCDSCHIESQSLNGLSGAAGKVTIDQRAINFLATAIATGHNSNGTIEDYGQGQADQTQTALNLWGLDRYQDSGRLFNIKLSAAMFLHSKAIVSGSQTHWPLDYTTNPAWWESQDGLTGLITKNMVGVLQAASRVQQSSVVSYAWKALTPSGFGAGDIPNDIKLGPDGLLYTLGLHNAIFKTDPTTGVTSSFKISGLPANSYGLAIAPDGTLYIGGDGYVARVAPGQTAATIISRPTGIVSVALSPSGVLYASDNTTNQLLKLNSDGTFVVLLDSTMLNLPATIAFDSAGNLMLAGGSNYNFIEVAADGTVSTFASGMLNRPLRITSDGQGGWYVATFAERPLQYYDAPQMYHFTPDGVGQSVQSGSGGNYLAGITMLDGMPVTVDINEHLIETLVPQPVPVAPDLAVLQKDVTGAAQYFLGDYQDGDTSRLVQAMRIWGMGEARSAVTDPGLQDQLSQAIAYIDAQLRSEQDADGGWGTTPTAKSDAMVTAVVGLALDYSHPSPSDTVTRNAIEFLLNSQAGDGSWSSADGIMQTKLASTGLVMDYLPDALQFLGGIDVDLHIQDVPGKVSLGTFVPGPASTLIGGDGSSTYNWHLTGVTSEEDVGFDVNLPNLLANETRPVAGSAYLQFKNSFTGELLTSNLDIPMVQAVSGLGLNVAVDRPQYPANTPVVISGTVGNSGVPTTNAQVRLEIVAADGTDVADLPAISGLAIATGGQQSYTAQWNTGAYLAGAYTVKATLVDDAGTVATTATALFAIVNSNGGVSGVTEAALRTSTDRIVYNTTDTVAIADLVQSVTENQILSLVHLHVVVTDPSGNNVGTYDHDLGQLAPGAIQNVSDILALRAAAQGAYTVSAALTDSTGTMLANGSATFTVTENLARTLIGQVTVQSPSVYEGNPEVCTDTAINNGTQALSGEPLQALVVNIASQAAISTSASTATLNPGQQQQSQQTIDTTSLAVGDYACVLQAQVNGAWSTLSYAAFHVTDPTAALTGTLAANPPQVPLTTAVALTGGVTNGGDATISGITATITIQDPSGNTVFTSPASIASLTAGQVNPLLANWAVAGNVGDVDTAILTVTVGPRSRVLAQAQFSILPPPIKLGISQSAPAFNRILVLLNCPQGDEGDDHNHDHNHLAAHDSHDHQSTCLVSRSATLASLFKELGVSYKLTTDLPDFITAFRSGVYNHYWVLGVLPEGDSTAEVGEELEEAVNRGDSLLVDAGLNGGHNQELLQVAGAQYKGQLPQNYRGPASLLAPIFTPANLPTSKGDINLVTLAGAEAASFSDAPCGDGGEGDDHLAKANVAHDGHDDRHHSCTPHDAPAILTNTYGLGHAAALGFDLLTTLQQYPAAGWQAAIGSLLQTLTPAVPASLQPLGYLPLITIVQNEGVATTFSLTDDLPPGASMVDASPAPVSSSATQVSWNAPLAVDQSLSFEIDLRLPAASGSYSLAGEVGTTTNGDLTPYGSYSLPLTIEDTSGLEQQLSGELIAIEPTCHGDDDKHRIADAEHEYQDALNLAGQQVWDDAIGELLEAGEDLEHLSGVAPATARLDLDRLLQAFELQWSASGASHGGHR